MRKCLKESFFFKLILRENILKNKNTFIEVMILDFFLEVNSAITIGKMCLKKLIRKIFFRAGPHRAWLKKKPAGPDLNPNIFFRAGSGPMCDLSTRPGLDLKISTVRVSSLSIFCAAVPSPPFFVCALALRGSYYRRV